MIVIGRVGKACDQAKSGAKSSAASRILMDISSSSSGWGDIISPMMKLRRLVITKDVVYSEAGKDAPRPITRAVALAVIANPFATQHHKDLSLLFDFGA